MALSANQYGLKVQSLENILAQTAALKVHAELRYSRLGKDTQIGLFLKFCKGGTKGKPPRKQADFRGSKITSAQMALSANQYGLKVQSLENILAQTAALKVHAELRYSRLGKDTQIGLFLKFCKGGTKGKPPRKQADFRGSKITSAQMALSANQYGLKVQSLENILAQTAALKVHAELRYSRLGKDTQIGLFLKFCKGGTKGKPPRKQADFRGSKITSAQMALSANQYGLKVQSLENILAQTAALKVHAELRYSRLGKDTQIGLFLKFCKGGTKGKPPRKQADFRGSKITSAQMALSANQYGLKVQSLENILAQTAALKVHAELRYSRLGKDTQIGLFLKFCKGGTKGKPPRKQADFRGSKITSAQMALSANQYGLKVQSLENILAQTAALKVHAELRYSRLGKDTQIGLFLKFCKGGTKGKPPRKQADFRGSKITSAQMALSANQYGLKVQSLENILAQTAALKVHAELRYSRLGKDTQIGLFLKFCKGGTKGKPPRKQADFRGSKITSAQMALSANQYGLKVQSLENILAQTAALKVHAELRYSRLGKDTQIGLFLKFCKGGTKGKPPRKQADFRGSKITSAQMALSANQYGLKVQSLENILAQTAALKVHAELRYSRLGKDTQIGLFFEILQRGDQGKTAQKVGRLQGLQNHLGANGAVC